MIDAVHDGAAAGECDVDVVCEKLFEGYRQKGTAPAVVAAEAALRACGYEPRRIVTGGGSDANALDRRRASTCVNLANGTERNHEPTERVSVAALEGMLDVCLALLDEAARVVPADELALRAPRGAHRRSRARSSTSARARSATRTARRSRASGSRTPARSAIVAHDGEHVWLVRQPREATGDPDLLELPAGKLDEEGESPLECAPARAGRGDRQGRRALGAPDDATTRRPASPTSSATSSSPPACATSPATRSRASGSTSSRIRSPSSTRRSPTAATRRRSSACCCCATRLRALNARVAPGRRPPPAPAKAVQPVAIATPPASDPAVRAPAARLPRLPGVRARPVAQHARGLPLRPAPVRRVARAHRPRPARGRPRRAERVRRRARRRARGPAARGARDAAAQDRLPALVLPPPAPHRRPDRPTRPRTCARRSRAASCRRCSAATRSPSCCASRAGPSRPRCATARCWRRCTPADCARRRRSGSRSATSTSRPASCAPAARAPRSGSCPIGSAAAGALGAYLQRGRPRLVGDRWEARLFVNQRGGGLTRQGLYKIVQRHAATRRARGEDEPAHAAPHVRHAPARRRLRPALAAGDARPRRHRHDAALHAPLGRAAQGRLLRRPPAARTRRPDEHCAPWTGAPS